MKEEREEYYLLRDFLDEIDRSLEGKCNDIDCNQYVYRDLLKKKYKPVLEHNFSCLDSLKRQRDATFRLLSMREFLKFRYEKCSICQKQLDTISEDATIVGFTKPTKDRKLYRYESIRTHQRCSRLVKISKGWKKL